VSFIFRGIGNKAWWYKDRSDFPWLREGEIIADVLKGLGTTRGALSIYEINEDKSNLHRVIAAYTTTRNSVNDVDYVLVPIDTIKEKFALEKTRGHTADDVVNGLHFDIIHLTPSKLIDLAYVFRDHREAMQRLRKKKIEIQIRQGLENGYIDFKRINKSLEGKFGKQ